MKKRFSIFFLIVPFFVVIGCSNNTGGNNTECSQPEVIELTLENYWYYLDVVRTSERNPFSNPYQTGNVMTFHYLSFYGAIDDVLYKDVVITYRVSGQNNNLQLKLNIGGYGVAVRSNDSAHQITAVAGSVEFRA